VIGGEHDIYLHLEVAVRTSVVGGKDFFSYLNRHLSRSCGEAVIFSMMSSVVEDSDQNNIMMCCAACGTAEVDEIKLMRCTACKSVRYCGVKCQKDHRRQHKKECRKRAAELRDELLFKQQESSHLGDCPICFIPLSLDLDKSIMMSCCSKVICKGCQYANNLRIEDERIQHSCPFCRKPTVETDEECDKLNMKRIEVNDPAAMSQKGSEQYIKGDHNKAFEYFTKASGLGDVEAHYKLSILYQEGHGVEKDKGKYLHHMEQAAIGGHPLARFSLACSEGGNGRHDRGVKHLTIAANLGHDKSLDSLKKLFSNGLLSKEDFAAALRGHQAAIDAMKSPQRKAAEIAGV